MIKAILTPLAFVLPAMAFAQDTFSIGYTFGEVNLGHVTNNSFAADTSASAYVIHEYGNAFVDPENAGNLIFEYHTKIKILKQSAASYADIEIPLYKTEDREEIVRRILAKSYNADGKKLEETKLDQKTVFTEKNKKYYNVVKFAIPNVRAGSVIEYQYRIESPFFFNFRSWPFQAEIPKLRSEYHTSIPANYKYNITLRGFLKLTTHESSIQRECLAGGNGSVADCELNDYVMTNIPAFKEEEFMLSKSNFMSAINFQLSQVTHWDGRVDKYTKEWKDADQELKTHSDFGIQLKRGKEVVDDFVSNISISGEADPLAKAKKIYDYVKFHYVWNGFYGSRSEFGIKKAFDEKKGNVGDINLTLIAALRYAGLTADPVLLATRSEGRPTEIHPVLSDFNYVIAKLVIGEKSYLLDAVDDFLPFGSISLRCYNGIGRVMSPDGSYWMELKPTDKDRTVTYITLKLLPDGTMSGTISETSYGYAAIRKRKELQEINDEKSYLEKRKTKHPFMEITSYERSSDEDLSKPLTEKFGVEFSAFDSPETPSFLFNPFLAGRKESNPFKSDTRSYPVDFAVPQDENVTIIIELPDNYEVASKPDNVGLTLPNAGGRYMFGAMISGNKLTISNLLAITRPIYSADEYPYLKEIYARMVQTQNTDLIFQKKK
jgi:transglutaminase-like putative cysteine protease